MWLSDYEMAIEAMRDVFQDARFEVIACAYDGSRVVFEPIHNGCERFVYFPKTGRIVKEYWDTWRNPEHVDVYREGK